MIYMMQASDMYYDVIKLYRWYTYIRLILGDTKSKGVLIYAILYIYLYTVVAKSNWEEETIGQGGAPGKSQIGDLLSKVTKCHAIYI